MQDAFQSIPGLSSSTCLKHLRSYKLYVYAIQRHPTTDSNVGLKPVLLHAVLNHLLQRENNSWKEAALKQEHKMGHYMQTKIKSATSRRHTFHMAVDKQCSTELCGLTVKTKNTLHVPNFNTYGNQGCADNTYKVNWDDHMTGPCFNSFLSCIYGLEE